MKVDTLVASALCGIAKLITGVRAIWRTSTPTSRQRVYFANHRSHGDFLLIWASLPPALRRHTRPVAGADYWLKGAVRRYIARRVFQAVLIDREAKKETRESTQDPIGLMAEVLSAGDSLIIFPEGTRNLGEGLLPFKSGIFRLAQARPEVELVPVWIENLGRVMPKGSMIPVPLLCSLTFGPALQCLPGESRDDFLARARNALLDLAPPAD